MPRFLLLACLSSYPLSQQISIIASYDADGNYRWSNTYGGIGDDFGSSIAIDGNDNIYVGGTFRDSISFGGSMLASNGAADVFVASFTSDGAHRWSAGYGSTDLDSLYGLAVGPDDSVHLAGNAGDAMDLGGGAVSSPGSSAVSIASYSSAGLHNWSNGYECGIVSALAVACDAGGNLYVTGFHDSDLDLGGGTLSAADVFKIFVASYSAAGTHRWSKSFGFTGLHMGCGLAADNLNNLFGVGSAAGDLDMGQGALTSHQGDVLLFKMPAQ